MKTYKPHLCYRGLLWWCLGRGERGTGLSPAAAYDSMVQKSTRRINAVFNRRPQA
ncbi:hypothetical protein ACS9ZL_08455 [Stenotrophomonas africana]